MSQRQTRPGDDVDDVRQELAAACTPCTPVVIWVHDGPVCVTIIDEPARPVRDNCCHCDACRAAQHDGWTVRFI